MRRVRVILSRLFCNPFAVTIVCAILWIGAPLMTGAAQQMACFAIVNILLACSINVLTGMAGQISLSQAAFMGIATYATVLLVKFAGWPLWTSMPCGVVLAATAGYLLSFPAGRVREFYLAMMTLGFGMIFVEVAREWDSVTGGVMGITGVPSPQLRNLTVFGIRITTVDYLRLLIVVGSATLFMLDRFVRSRFGRAYFAIHESETAASSIGIDSAAIKRQAYVLGAALAGLAGALYGHLVSYVGPESFELHRSIEILVMSVVGGLGSLAGQILGAVALTLLPRKLELFEDFKFIFYGLVLIAIFVVMPRGIAGFLLEPPRMIAARLRRPRPMAHAPVPARAREPGRTVLSWRGLTRAFGGLTAVANFSFEVASGEVVGLVGPNGSGKSTTVNILTGIYPPSEGRVMLKGADVTGLPSHAIARQGMVRTFQDPRLVGRFTVLENVMLGRHIHLRYGLLDAGLGIGRMAAQECAGLRRAAEVLALTGLGEVSERVLETLPYGYRRMVEVARSLMVDPDVLLLDEPAAGLSEGEIGKLEEVIVNLRERGVAILVIDHHMDFLARLVDRVVVLDSGIEIFRGTMGAMRDDPRVAECYLGQKEPAGD